MRLPWKPRRQHWNLNRFMKVRLGFSFRLERQQGNNAAALRAFEKYRAKLKEDMGLAPSEAMVQLIAGVS